MEFSSPIGCKTDKATNRSDEKSCVSVIEERPRSFNDETSCASSVIEEKPRSFIDETSCSNVIDGTPYPFGKRNSLVCCHCNLSFLNYTELVLHRRSHFSQKSYFSVLNQNILSPSDIGGDDSEMTLCNDSGVTETSYHEPFVSTSNVVNKTDQFFVRMKGETGNEQIFAFETFEQPLERLSADCGKCNIIINETYTLGLENITHRPRRSQREHFAESDLNYVANTPTAKSFLSKCKVSSRKLPKDRQLLYPEKYLKNLSSRSRDQRKNRKSSQKSSSNQKDGSSIITQNTEDKMNYTNYTETMSLEEETNDTNNEKTISLDEEINDINYIKPTSLEEQINNTKYTELMSLEEQINNTKYTESMSLEEQINNTKYTELMSLEEQLNSTKFTELMSLGEEFHNFEISTNETANVPVSVDKTCINASTTVHLTRSQFNRSLRKSYSDSEGISFTCINAISTPKLVDEESNRQRLIDLNRTSHFSDESSYENRRQHLEDSNTVVIDESNGYDFNESTSQLINESTSQQINKLTSERINKSTSQRINEWMNQTINDSTSERIDECMSKKVNEFLYESFSSQDLLATSSGNSSHLLDYGCLDSMVIGNSDVEATFSNNQHRSSSAINRPTEQISDAQEYPSEVELADGGNITETASASSSLQSDSSPDFKLRKMSILEEIEARIMNQLAAENFQTQENVDSENEEKFQHLIAAQENFDSGNEEKFQHFIATQVNVDSGNEEKFQHFISIQENADSSDSESVEKFQHPTDWLREEHKRVIANWCKGEESTEFKCCYCEEVCESHDQLCLHVHFKHLMTL